MFTVTQTIMMLEEALGRVFCSLLVQGSKCCNSEAVMTVNELAFILVEPIRQQTRWGSVNISKKTDW